MMTPDLDAVREQFAANFTGRGELGASVSIWHEGREILSLAHGWRDRQQTIPWTPDTLVLLWSITKGLAAACLLHALAADAIPLETPVATCWPEFARNGKGGITLAQLLSHRAGLAAMADPAPSLLDHAAVAEALAAQAPAWPLGPNAHGYHARTYGFLVDEVLRRLRPGQTLAQYWRAEFAGPLGLDLWIGLPAAEEGRVAAMYPARGVGAQPLDPFYDALADETSLTRRAFMAPRGLHSVAAMNAPEARRASLPSLGAIGTARALGQFYAMLAAGGAPFFPPGAVRQMSEPLTAGPDLILCHRTAFSAGFMMDPLDAAGRKERAIFGPSPRAFGQPGAGGGHAFADPDAGIAFAYVMNQMELGVLPNAKSRTLVQGLYGGGGVLDGARSIPF